MPYQPLWKLAWMMTIEKMNAGCFAIPRALTRRLWLKIFQTNYSPFYFVPQSDSLAGLAKMDQNLPTSIEQWLEKWGLLWCLAIPYVQLPLKRRKSWTMTRLVAGWKGVWRYPEQKLCVHSNCWRSLTLFAQDLLSQPVWFTAWQGGKSCRNLETGLRDFFNSGGFLRSFVVWLASLWKGSQP